MCCCCGSCSVSYGGLLTAHPRMEGNQKPFVCPPPPSHVCVTTLRRRPSQCSRPCVTQHVGWASCLSLHPRPRYGNLCGGTDGVANHSLRAHVHSQVPVTSAIAFGWQPHEFPLLPPPPTLSSLVCAYVRACACVYVCVWLCVWLCAWLCACVCVCVCVCACVCVCVLVCACVCVCVLCSGSWMYRRRTPTRRLYFLPPTSSVGNVACHRTTCAPPMRPGDHVVGAGPCRVWAGHARITGQQRPAPA